MVMSTVEDIKDWVKAEGILSLIVSGIDYLEFHDGRHYYRIIGGDGWGTDVALMEGFNRWGPDAIYRMGRVPHSKESLMKLVRVCNHLSNNRDIGSALEEDIEHLMNES